MANNDWQTRIQTGRNEPCPCKSGKKYKKCHLAADENAERLNLSKINAEAAAKAEAEGESGGPDRPVHDHAYKPEKSGPPRPHAPMNASRPVNAPRKTGPS